MPASFDETVTAPLFQGNLSGNVSGALTGSVTGPVTGSLTGNVIGNLAGGEQHTVNLLAGDGAIAIPSASQDYAITKGSIAALTIVAPTVGTDDGKELTVWSETAFAHVITCAAVGFSGKNASGTLTWNGTRGSSVKFKARNGQWWVTAINGVTIA
jgi:hypothetical protein